MNTVITCVIILSCFVVGKFFKYKTDHIDHPIEQAVEGLLKDNGVDVDFSANKKK